MTTKTLAFEDLEKVYELLDAAIDAVREKKETLLLSKLCLILAHRVGELGQLEETIRVAQQNLDR